MYKIQTDGWQMDVPEEWTVDKDEESLLIADPDGVGELQITSLDREKGEISDQDLQQFANEQMDKQNIIPEIIKLSGMSGFLYEYESEGLYWREWFLKRKSFLFCISYTCDVENKTLDIKVIDEILETTEFVN